MRAKRKTHERWCSKHQRVHGVGLIYWSCRFPNSQEMNKKPRRPKAHNGMSTHYEDW